MRILVAYALTAVLFAHAALGCCWHHGHASAHCLSDRCNCNSSDAETALGHEHEDPQPSGPCNCRFECQGSHRAIRPQRIGLISLEAIPGFEIAAAKDSATAALGGAAVLRCRTANSPEVPTRLRAHLLYQVFLI